MGGMTQTELDVLQKLQERRESLDVRERDIVKREALLKAAEDQIDRRVAEMKTLQNTIEGLLRQYNDQEDNKMRSLVKIYENMKPKEAAKIFVQLDMNSLGTASCSYHGRNGPVQGQGSYCRIGTKTSDTDAKGGFGRVILGGLHKK
jgi:hypothetical protein